MSRTRASLPRTRAAAEVQPQRSTSTRVKQRITRKGFELQLWTTNLEAHSVTDQ